MTTNDTAKAMCAISGMAYNDAKGAPYNYTDYQNFLAQTSFGKPTRVSTYDNPLLKIHPAILVEYDDCVVLGFAGTVAPSLPEGLIDWGLNADFKQVPYMDFPLLSKSIELVQKHYPDATWLGKVNDFLGTAPELFPLEWRVHQGFQIAMLQCLLLGYSTQNPDGRDGNFLFINLFQALAGKKHGLYITGHSQGGGMSMVSVPFLFYLGSIVHLLFPGEGWANRINLPVSVYTFASPRPGNMAFATSVCALTQATVGYANWLDPVPWLPLACNISSKYGMACNVYSNWGVPRTTGPVGSSESSSAPTAQSVANDMLNQLNTPPAASASSTTATPAQTTLLGSLGHDIESLASDVESTFDDILNFFVDEAAKLASEAPSALAKAMELVAAAAAKYYGVSPDNEQQKGLFMLGVYVLHCKLLDKLVALSDLLSGHSTSGISALAAGDLDLLQQLVKLLFKNNFNLQQTGADGLTLLGSSNDQTWSEWFVAWWKSILEAIKALPDTLVEWGVLDFAHVGSRVYITSGPGTDNILDQHFLYNYMKYLNQ